MLGLRAKTCGAGKVLDEEQVQAAKKEDVLNALSQIASRFRTRVGESLTTVKSHDTPLEEATTPSLEALKAYSTALKHWLSSGDADTVPLLKRAIEIDGQFAMAHALLGRVYADLWEPVLAAESSRKAYELRNRVSDPERYYIMVPHDLDDTGNLEKAQQTAEMWAETYPLPRRYSRAPTSHGSTRCSASMKSRSKTPGKLSFSIRSSRRVLTILLWTYIQLNRPAGGREHHSPSLTSSRSRASIWLFSMRYTIAFLRGDQAGMQREAAQSEGGCPLRRPDSSRGILHAGLLRPFAGGQEEIAPGSGLGPADAPQARKCGDV